jgi:hypothetical protein
VVDEKAGLQVNDVSKPANPRRVGGNSGVGASEVLVVGTNVFVAFRFSGLAKIGQFARCRLASV